MSENVVRTMDPVAEAINRLSQQFSTQIQVINTNMERLAERVSAVESEGTDKESAAEQTPTPRGRTPFSWADRPLDETVDYQATLTWPEEDAGEQKDAEGDVRPVSDTAKNLLENYFSRSVANSQRRQWWKKYAVPQADCTKCSKLYKLNYPSPLRTAGQRTARPLRAARQLRVWVEE